MTQAMYGPLLLSLLPPERIGAAAKATPDQGPWVALLILAGIFLCLWLRPPER
ncbi:MAG: hypothetical protein M1377_00760 [Deltaproteobacteria bacterium]|nr:hypothetical protein [Deltaproteobacteria bacterium]